MRQSKILFDELVAKIKPIYEINEAKSIIFMVFKQFIGFTKTDVLVNKPISQNYDFNPIINRLLANEPVQYIIGKAEFYGHKFIVEKGVTLIPRPETEELVLLAISKLKKAKPANGQLQVLDIGTGTGCIAISIAKAIDNVMVTAIDIAPETLEIAELNARLLGVNINFELHDALNFPENYAKKFDLIISNPPYITVSEKPEMNKNVLDFEPEIALFVSDKTPIIFYEKIAEFAKKTLNKNGYLMVEINERFGKETALCFEKTGFNGTEIINDINGKPRIILTNKN